MKNRAFAMFSCLTALTAAGAFAQSTAVLRADIPFEFRVGGTLLPAGQYEVVPQTGRNLLEIQCFDCKTAGVLVRVQWVEAAARPDKGELIFHRYGNAYFLSKVWSPGSSQGREMPASPAERELASNGPAMVTAIAAMVER
jgi:hypothetical protein